MVDPKKQWWRGEEVWKRIGAVILNSNRGPFVEHIRDTRFLVTLAILLALGSWISHVWILDHANLAGVDVFQSVKRPRLGRHSVVIKLTESDYNRLFGNCVTPAGLRKLIESIEAFGPSVIAIDVATSADSFRALDTPESPSRLVWARAALRQLQHGRSSSGARYEWAAGEVLGHKIRDPEYTGVSLFPQDSDWVIRAYQRWFRLGNGTVPSMHWEIIRAYCDSGSQEACNIVREAPSIDTTLHSITNRYEFPPIALSDVLPNLQGKGLLGAETFQPENVLRGKIVVMGAAYGDEHATAFGVQEGPDLIASAVETELDRTGEPFAVRGWTQMLAKVLLALVLAALHHYVRPLYALSGTLMIVCGVICLSFVVYYYEALRLDFLPFVVGIWVEQLYEGAEHAQRADH
jgi:hypothetical protein